MWGLTGGVGGVEKRIVGKFLGNGTFNLVLCEYLGILISLNDVDICININDSISNSRKCFCVDIIPLSIDGRVAIIFFKIYII